MPECVCSRLRENDVAGEAQPTIFPPAKLPSQERFRLGDQWRRAAESVALNIAEGASRSGPRQFRRYLDIALGSLHELEAILELVEALEYVPDQELRELQLRRANCARMVYGLFRKMTERTLR